jgi:hypothetical protein
VLYKEGGEAALENRSLRPQRSPRRLAVARVAAIMAVLRRRRISLPTTALTFSLFLTINENRQLGLNKASYLQPGPSVVRYEHSRPDEMILLDIKNLGHIEVVGPRITGDRSQRKCGVGWE